MSFVKSLANKARSLLGKDPRYNETKFIHLVGEFDGAEIRLDDKPVNDAARTIIPARGNICEHAVIKAGKTTFVIWNNPDDVQRSIHHNLPNKNHRDLGDCNDKILDLKSDGSFSTRFAAPKAKVEMVFEAFTNHTRRALEKMLDAVVKPAPSAQKSTPASVYSADPEFLYDEYVVSEGPMNDELSALFSTNSVAPTASASKKPASAPTPQQVRMAPVLSVVVTEGTRGPLAKQAEAVFAPITLDAEGTLPVTSSNASKYGELDALPSEPVVVEVGKVETDPVWAKLKADAESARANMREGLEAMQARRALAEAVKPKAASAEVIQLDLPATHQTGVIFQSELKYC